MATPVRTKKTSGGGLRFPNRQALVAWLRQSADGREILAEAVEGEVSRRFAGDLEPVLAIAFPPLRPGGPVRLDLYARPWVACEVLTLATGDEREALEYVEARIPEVVRPVYERECPRTLLLEWLAGEDLTRREADRWLWDQIKTR